MSYRAASLAGDDEHRWKRTSRRPVAKAYLAAILSVQMSRLRRASTEENGSLRRWDNRWQAALFSSA